jgi:hypothetical protein
MPVRRVQGARHVHASHLEKVTAKVDELIAILERNQKAHDELYDKLAQLYVQKAKDVLAARLTGFDRWMPELDLPNMKFELEPPDYYGPCYEQAIGMLKLHQSAGNQTIDLTDELYRAYVLDKWQWEEQFSFKNTRMYGV